MSLTIKQADVMQKIQRRVLSLQGVPDFNVSHEISARGEYLWSRLCIVEDGEILHMSTVGIDNIGEHDCLGDMTLERQLELVGNEVVRKSSGKEVTAA